MSTKNSSLQKIKSAFALITIPLVIVISFILYFTLLGNPENFSGGTPRCKTKEVALTVTLAAADKSQRIDVMVLEDMDDGRVKAF